METESTFDHGADLNPGPYQDEARRRWGHTDAYKESARRTRRYGKRDWTRIKEEGDEVEAGLARLMTQGTGADDDRAMDLAERHRRHIDRWFYPCTHAMHLCLAKMYTADDRFTEHFDKRATGLAAYVQDAIRANAARSARRS